MEIVLDVVTDPEVTEDQELIISIHTSLPPGEAFRKLNQLDDEWWLDASINAQEKICIHVEFK